MPDTLREFFRRQESNWFFLLLSFGIADTTFTERKSHKTVREVCVDVEQTDEMGEWVHKTAGMQMIMRMAKRWKQWLLMGTIYV